MEHCEDHHQKVMKMGHHCKKNDQGGCHETLK